MLVRMKTLQFAEQMRQLIDDNTAHEAKYYNSVEENNVEDIGGSEGGTHVSVLHADGSAVSATSSLGSLYVLNLTTSEHVSPQLIALLLTQGHSIIKNGGHKLVAAVNMHARTHARTHAHTHRLFLSSKSTSFIKSAVDNFLFLTSHHCTVEPLLYDHPQNHIGVVV